MKQYALSSILIITAILVVFYARFEKKKVRTRRMVIIAVMTALSVIGRFVFSAIPAFKPISAIVVITAIWLGPECGFMVGSLSALISNMYFGQGPWTPFQMIAWGLIGVIAGLPFLSKLLKRSRLALSIYGIISGAAFSCIMDVWTVIWYNGEFSWSLLAAAIISAAPFIISYAVSNVIFLLTLGKPFGEKLERVIIKYGI